LLSFATDTLRVTTEPVPLVLALAMAPLICGRLQTALVLIDLWLLSELLACLMDPGYRFGTLLAPRLIATALQLTIVYGVLICWRHWRQGSASVSAH
jgi:hypothetical protein